MTQEHGSGPDAAQRARELARRAEEADDETRLELLDDLHQALEEELDRDIDQTGSPGR